MQALPDDQRIDSLERKVEEGFAETRAQILASERVLRGEITSVRTEITSVRTEVISARSDARQDFRTLLAVVFGMWTTTVLAVIGILLNHT
jgi:hypothetical protein